MAPSSPAMQNPFFSCTVAKANCIAGDADYQQEVTVLLWPYCGFNKVAVCFEEKIKYGRCCCKYHTLLFSPVSIPTIGRFHWGLWVLGQHACWVHTHWLISGFQRKAQRFRIWLHINEDYFAPRMSWEWIHSCSQKEWMPSWWRSEELIHTRNKRNSNLLHAYKAKYVFTTRKETFWMHPAPFQTLSLINSSDGSKGNTK